MIEINLLPKELQHRRFKFQLDKNLIYVISGGVAILLILGAYSFIFQANKISKMNDEIQQAQQRKAQFSAEIQKIEAISRKKEQITARMTAIQILNQNRDYWVQLMEDLVRRVPEYVWLTTFQQAPQGGQTAAPGQQAVQGKSTLEGYSFSLNALATFLVRMKKSELFKNVEIASIGLQETDKAKAYSFKFTYELVMPGLEVAAAEGTQVSPGAGTQF